MKRSITLRLVAMFAVAALATFALIGAALYGVLQNELMRYQKDDLQTAWQDMEYMIKRVGDSGHWSHVQTKMDTLTLANRRHRYWVRSGDPQFEYGENLATIDQIQKTANDMGTLTLPQDVFPLYTLTRTIPAYKDRPVVQLTVGVDSAPYLNTLHTFLLALITLSLVAVLLVMLLGYWIARVGLRPLARLSSDARTLSPRTLSQRLQVSPLPDELSNLAITFNDALGRLETAYNQLEAFNADVAHELRTPLTNLIGETQVALSRPRTAPQFQEVLQSNLEELERLRSIVNDMLFLARADQGEVATGLIQTPIAREIGKTAEFLEFVLDESQMTVKISGDTQTEALIEVALFRRAMANLLQNAIEHSTRGAEILVQIKQQPALIRVAVCNPGLPIATNHLPLLFDRFYRADAARHNGVIQGHGLGLAIVKAVANMHGGDVFANSADGYTTIGFNIPT